MLVALVLGPVWAAGPMLAPRVSATDPLPACRYDDVPTAFTSPDDWQRTLVDTIYMVGKSYVPPDLVPVTDAGISGNGEVRSLVIGDLRALAMAAKAAGAPIAVQSAYRSYATQVYTFNYWTQTYGHSAALLGSARPGHSEHQLGVALDFRSAGTSATWVADWTATPAGAWMEQNAWRYGFVMSYPKDASPGTTCYRYEPWHYRYVGRDEAAAIHATGTTIRQYLWFHAGDGGLAGDSPLPSATATPVAAPTAAAPSSSQPTPRDSAPPGALASVGPGPAVVGPGTSPGASPETAVQATTGTGDDRTGTPVTLLLRALGIMLGIVLGLAILAGAERLDRTLREVARGLRLA
jgi:zinc D-Ala-D-Ala carboxypeptidase